MQDSFDKNLANTAATLAQMDPDELRTVLDHSIDRAKLRAVPSEVSAPRNVADFGIEAALTGVAGQRKEAIQSLLTSIRDREANGYALGRFLIALKPCLIHRRADQDAIQQLFDACHFPFKLRSFIYDYPFFLKLPLIDREALREKLYELFEDPQDELRLLVIHGTGLGKTHCRWLVQGVTKEIWGVRPIYLDLLQFAAEPSGEDGLGPLWTLCQEIATELGLRAEFRSAFLNTPLRQAQQFCTWVAGEMKKQKDTATARQVIMFDHMSKEGVHHELSGLAMHSAQRARDGQFGNVYVILLECDQGTADKLLSNGPGACEDVPRNILKDHIDSFLSQVTKMRALNGRKQCTVPEEVRKLVDSSTYPLDRQTLFNLCKNLKAWQMSG